MKKNIIIGLGAFVLLLGVLSNLQWAATDYGYKTASLHPQIMAQDTVSGTGDKKGGDVSTIKYKVTKNNCVMLLTGKANGTAKFGLINIQLNAEGEAKLIYENAEIQCEEGGTVFDCKTKFCWEVFQACGTFLNN